ncbi:Myb-like DNA-binding domain-containing protein [Spironucleus salmonicida]|uniref:Myb-like DNA-binding domain-containing protein n=1 Tax=Spironucleus salmonicida TaxID=348837 RepID=V6LPY6_9EUKA|nr:Myb-like DNA-binding domain-containing protein [Spironucleus salmonicida]|eukprot:EST42819.1 Myb-like DNA-binding domain-containing protein [Spironucleus salmonicida]
MPTGSIQFDYQSDDELNINSLANTARIHNSIPPPSFNLNFFTPLSQQQQSSFNKFNTQQILRRTNLSDLFDLNKDTLPFMDQNCTKEKTEGEHTRKLKLAPKWNIQEDQVLIRLIAQYGPKKWRFLSQKISQATGLPERQPDAVSQRWTRVINPDIQKTKWSIEEDTQLINIVKLASLKQWKEVAAKLPGRTDIQVRYRLIKLKPWLLSNQILSPDQLP